MGAGEDIFKRTVQETQSWVTPRAPFEVSFLLSLLMTGLPLCPHEGSRLLPSMLQDAAVLCLLVCF